MTRKKCASAKVLVSALLAIVVHMIFEAETSMMLSAFFIFICYFLSVVARPLLFHYFFENEILTVLHVIVDLPLLLSSVHKLSLIHI